MFSTPCGKPASEKISPQSSPPMNGDDSDGFEHDGVPERERRGDRARGEDQRRVPRRDRSDDADRPSQAERHRPRDVRRDDLADRRVRECRRLPEQPRRRSPSGTCRSRSSQPVSRARQPTTSSHARLEHVRGLQEDRAAALREASADHAGNAAAAASMARLRLVRAARRAPSRRRRRCRGRDRRTCRRRRRRPSRRR